MVIAVCDDEPAAALEILKLTKKHLPDCETEVFYSGRQLLNSQRIFDIIFLDIQMEGSDGIETAEILRGKGFSGSIIFITAIKDYVFKAFDVGAFNYLLKPVDESKFRKVLLKCAETVPKEINRLIIRTKDKNISIDADSILYLENELRKIAVHTFTDIITYYGVMSKAEEQLGENFFRCHRGYLVNMAHITEYSCTEITLSNGGKVYMAKSKYTAFIKNYQRFLRGKGASDV